MVGEFVFDGGEFAESALAASAVVGVLDPGDDRQAQLVSAAPRVAVEDVLLQERVEGFPGGVVGGGGDAAHRSRQLVREP